MGPDFTPEKLVEIIKDGTAEELKEIWGYFNSIRSDPNYYLSSKLKWKGSKGLLIKKKHNYWITDSPRFKSIEIRSGRNEIRIDYNYISPYQLTANPSRIIQISNNYTLFAIYLNKAIIIQESPENEIKRYRLIDLLEELRDRYKKPWK